MSLFTKKSTEAANEAIKKRWPDVIQDNGPEELLFWRVPEHRFALHSRLIVFPCETAYVFKDETVVGKLDSGTYFLDPNRYPALAPLVSDSEEGKCIDCTIVYLRNAPHVDFRWSADRFYAHEWADFGKYCPGSRETPPFRRVEFSCVGTASARILRAAGLKQLMIERSEFSFEEASRYFSSTYYEVMQEAVKRAAEAIPFQEYWNGGRDIDRQILADRLYPPVRKALSEYGLDLIRFSVDSSFVEFEEEPPHVMGIFSVPTEITPLSAKTDTTDPDPLEELPKLRDLLDKRLITQAEYDEKVKDILSKL